MVKQEWTMDDHMGSDTPKKGRWQHQLHTWARQSLVREVWEWVRCKDVTLPNVRQLAESIAELPTSAVDGVVHGSEWCWKNDDLQVRPRRIPGRRIPG